MFGLGETMNAKRTILAMGAAIFVAAAAAAGAQAVTESVHVVVGGGPLAGSYDATETKGGCSTGANGPGSWGNAFSNAKAGAKEIGALSLIVPDAKAAAAGTRQFFVQLRFGSILQQNVSYTIETRPTEKKQEGEGTVKVTDAGATAKVTIEGKTKDGIGFTATVDCKAVVRMGQ
jgi:hypothetical protein